MSHGEVVLVDTTVLLNVLRVPGRDQDAARVAARLQELLSAGASLILPIAVLVEVGGHIARLGEGGLRFQAARRLQQLADPDAGLFDLSQLPSADDLQDWLRAFPELVKGGISLADGSLIWHFERQRQLGSGRRVRIWSLDAHLAGYDSPAQPPDRRR